MCVITVSPIINMTYDFYIEQTKSMLENTSCEKMIKIHVSTMLYVEIHFILKL